MLAQVDLGEMGLSSPSEQVAYLLVERATLLERLEAAERRLESESFTGSLKEVDHQVTSRRRPNSRCTCKAVISVLNNECTVFSHIKFSN